MPKTHGHNFHSSEISGIFRGKHVFLIRLTGGKQNERKGANIVFLTCIVISQHVCSIKDDGKAFDSDPLLDD